MEVTIWDTDNKFEQPIIIKYTTDLLPIDEIKTFFSSFRYTVNSLPDNLEKRQELIVDSIKKHPAYVNLDDNTDIHPLKPIQKKKELTEKMLHNLMLLQEK